ncbi:MAG: RNA methyltransferase [Phycisphaerae bacterium]|nr:RNA methyltransferase [Phycisphaerae bacterium]
MSNAASSARVIELADLDDPRAAPYRNVRDADLRGAHGLYLVESAVCIERWLRAIEARRRPAAASGTDAPTHARREGRDDPRAAPPRLEVHSLLLAPPALERLRPALDAAGAGPVYAAPLEVVERISGYDHHHGALAMGRRLPDAGADELVDAIDRSAMPPAAADSACRDAGSAAPLLVADGIVHVDNMGSIFRNAAAFGAAGVLLSRDSADPLMRKTVRISMGHVFTVPWAVADDLRAAIDLLRRRGYRIVAAENEPDAKPIGGVSLRNRVAVVFGAEGRGVARGILDAADEIVRIPTRPGVPLNVAIASAIVLHEAIRADGNGGARGDLGGRG